MTSQRILITGPTASGKSGLAVELARRTHGEIVSVDSMKVFRGMDIGTAKPSRELRSEVPFHLIDIVEPWEEFSVGEYLPLALETVDAIEGRGRRVILCGGTALYVWALMEGLFRGPSADPDLRAEILREKEEHGLEALHRQIAARDAEVARKIHPNDERRIVRALEVMRLTGRTFSEQWRDPSPALEPGTYTLFAIDFERQELYRRIDRRVLDMVERGLIDEVRRLRDARDGHGLGQCASKCIGYREVLESLAAGTSERETVELIQRDTRRFAKQQMTWFRRFPIRWLAPDRAGELAKRVLDETS